MLFMITLHKAGFELTGPIPMEIQELASGGAASQQAGTALRRGETIRWQKLYSFG
jgi:hypothetical protein